MTEMNRVLVIHLCSSFLVVSGKLVMLFNLITNDYYRFSEIDHNHFYFEKLEIQV